jgi:hypothetical protein
MTLVLRATQSADLDFVLAAEADPGAAPFIVRWSRQAHELALADRDQAHLLVLAAGEPVGFVLLAGLTMTNMDSYPSSPASASRSIASSMKPTARYARWARSLWIFTSSHTRWAPSDVNE